MDSSLIRRHYIRHGFVLDVLPVVPMVMMFMPPHIQATRGFRLLKVLQLLKLHNFQEKMWAVEEKLAGSVMVNTLALVLMQLAVALFMVANTLACLWFWVQDERDGYVGGIANSWLASNPDLQEAIDGWLNLKELRRAGDYNSVNVDL